MSTRFRKILFLLIYLGLTGLFSYAFYDRHYRHLGCFNEQGRCFSEEGIVYTGGGMIWSVFALVFAALAFLSLVRLAWAARKKG